MQQNQFSVWRDKSKIRSDWSSEIANALSKSDIILLIWSENSSESNWVKNEWLTARALGKPIQLVIISALDKLPLPLNNLDAFVLEINENNDFDFNNTQRIVDKLKEAAESKLYQDYNYNILPTKRHIPYDPNPDFTGRDTNTVELYLEIIGDLSKLNYNKVGIVGIGGVGKTQLAVEFFYRYAFAFDKGIFWIDGYDPARWLEQIVSIARDYLELEIPNEEDIPGSEKNKKYFIEFQKYCSENGSKILLLVDNVIDPLDLNRNNSLFPGDPNSNFTILTLGCNLLFTTRRDFEAKLPNVIQHKLEMLLADSAYELLTKYRRPTSDEEEEYAKKTCNSLGYLPLAIVLIGGYLRKYSDTTVPEYYEEHIKDKLGSIDLDQISEDELATKHAAAVRSTFEPEWKILEKDYGEGSLQQQQQQQQETQINQDSKKLVSILSLFPESAIIAKNRLVIYSGIEKFGRTKLIRPAQSAINLLDELNLIDILEDGKSVRIHPLLREFVLEKVQKNHHVENLKLDSIINLKKKYYDDFSFLVDEYARERDVGDIDSILDDFKTVLEWSKNEKLKMFDDDDKIINSISSLYKILEQESHNLRLKQKNSFISSLPDKIDKRMIFAQQIHIRSTELSDVKVMYKSRTYLEKEKNSFNLKWAKVKDKSTLIRTLEGHASSVYSVAITPDGTKIISGSWDNSIKVWDLPTGRLLNSLEGHTHYVNSIAITPDGTKIVSGSYDSSIKVWDLPTGRLLNSLEGHTHYVNSIAITPDGSKIVSGSYKTIKVWDLASSSLVNTLKGDTNFVYSVTVTPDGTKIVSCSDKTIKVWDLVSGSLLNTLEGHNSPVYSVAVTPDGTKILSGSVDSTIKIWGLASGKLLNTLVGHASPVYSVAVTPDSTKIVSVSGDDTIKVWDLPTGRLSNSLEGHTSDVHSSGLRSVAITPDGTKIISGSWDPLIKVWELGSSGLVNTLEGHTSPVWSVAITPDGSKIVSGSGDKTIKVWDFASGSLLNTLEGHTSSVESVAVTSDGSKIVSGSWDNTIKVWDLVSYRLENTIEGHTSRVRWVAITPDGTKIVSGSEDSTLKLWDLASGRLLNTLEDHTSDVWWLEITPDGTKIVSGSSDKTIKVWDLASGRLLNTLEDHTDWVWSVAITPDGTKIVSGSVDSTIKLWDLGSGRLLNTLEGHTSNVLSVAVTPDGTKILSGSWDNTIRIWDINRGSIIFGCKFDSIISTIAISKNKNIMVIGDSNGEIYAINVI